MQLHSNLTLDALALVVQAVPKPAVYIIHEERTAKPNHWVKRSKVEADVLLPVRIGLAQGNLDKGPILLEEVSTPSNFKYGQHYTTEEVYGLFAPREQSVAAVREWLDDAGIHADRVSLSANKQWIQFDASVGVVEDLIQTDYHHYEHVATGSTNIGCEKYHVPEHVTQHIDYISPGLKLLVSSKPTQNLEKRTFGVTGGRNPIQGPILKALTLPFIIILQLALRIVCPTAILPGCIKAMYNITDTETEIAASNQLGIFGSLGDRYAQEDLNSFFSTLAPQIPQGTHPLLKGIDGATAPAPNVSAAGAESNLDLMASIPIIFPQTPILFQTDDNVYEDNYTYAGFFNNFLDALDGSYCSYSAFGQNGNSDLNPSYPDPAPGGYKGALQCGIYTPTNVISISYGGQESDLPLSHQKRQCNEFMKLGMRGHSIVIASGDSGVAGLAGDGSANGCLGSTQAIFSPGFPASCPCLTTVGATVLPHGSNVFEDQEVAVSDFPFGGGFSNIFSIPSYQKDAVETYFATSAPPYPYYNTTDKENIGANGGLYNRNGRGYPDVSAIGDNVLIYYKGESTLIGGTSASTPVFASILNRINEELIAVGKPTIGFVNPMLYSNPGAFHDITSGNNPGCNSNGFAVARGWDPVTGLGTPNYPALLKLFMDA